MDKTRALVFALVLTGGALIGLTLAENSAAQANCTTLCLTVGPGPTGANELRVSWNSTPSPSAVPAYVLARINAAGVTGELVPSGPGSRVEPAGDTAVCFVFIPVAYAGQSTGLHSPPPLCYYPVPASPTSVRLTVGVTTPCGFCPVMTHRLSAERITGTAEITLVGIPLADTGGPRAWPMSGTDAQFSGSGLSTPACYFAATAGPAPLVTGLICSLQGSVPAIVSDLPTPTPTPRPPTITPLLTPVAIVTAGTNPTGIAVNPHTNRVYVSDRDGRAVVVVDGVTNTVIGRVIVGGKPGEIAVDPDANRLYVATSDPDTLVVIDGETNTLVGAVPMPLSPAGVAVNPATHRGYVAASHFAPGTSAFIFVVDGATAQAVGTIVTPCCSTDLALIPETNRLYALNSPSMTGYRIDLTSNAVLDAFPAGSVPNDIVVDRLHHRLYVLRAIGQIGVIDTDTNTQVGTIGLGVGLAGGPVSTWGELTINETSQRLYALAWRSTDGDTGRLWIADAVTMQPLGSVPAGDRPSGVAVNPATGLVYVVDGDSLFVIRDSPQATEAQLQRVIPLN
jgi:YVTN family beta-propeller protein